MGVILTLFHFLIFSWSMCKWNVQYNKRSSKRRETHVQMKRSRVVYTVEYWKSLKAWILFDYFKMSSLEIIPFDTKIHGNLKAIFPYQLISTFSGQPPKSPKHSALRLMDWFVFYLISADKILSWSTSSLRAM